MGLRAFGLVQCLGASISGDIFGYVTIHRPNESSAMGHSCYSRMFCSVGLVNAIEPSRAQRTRLLFKLPRRSGEGIEDVITMVTMPFQLLSHCGIVHAAVFQIPPCSRYTIFNGPGHRYGNASLIGRSDGHR
jgi:hypothetical protein